MRYNFAFTRPARRFAGASVLAISLALGAPLQAQSADGDGDDENDKPDLTTSEIVIRGVRQQLSEAAQIEREADNIISVITADDAGQFPDQNIAETLQRVAGVTIIRDEGEGRFITVRGLSPEFTQVTVNGAQLGSSEPDGSRSVALDVIPSDLLSRVEIAKTLLPDQDHDSLGAKVDLRPLSAFDRGEPSTVRVAATGTYWENADAITPRLTIDATKRFDVGAGQIGIAGAFNYFEREVGVFRTESGSGPGLDFDDGIYYPAEIEYRIEDGRRERIGGTATIDYRSNDGSQLVELSFLYGRLEDTDIRIQQEVELRDSSGDELRNLVGGSGEFSDIDIDRQIFFTDTVDETFAIHLGGRNRIAEGGPVLSWAVDYSKNNYVEPGARATFRNDDDIIVNARWGRDFGDWDYVGLGDFDSPSSIEIGVQPLPSLWLYESALIIDEDRDDEILSYGFDLEQEFALGSLMVTLKGGFKQRQRDRSFLRGEFDLGVEDELDGTGLPQTIAEFDNTFVAGSSLDFGGGIEGGAVFPDLDELRDVLAQTFDIFGVGPTDLRRDFTAEEDVTAYYLMATLDFSARFQVIVGGRYEETDFTTSGVVARIAEVDGTPIPGQNSVGIETFDNDYSEFLPAVHLRWDPSRDVVVRASFSEGQVRPNFGAARALQTNVFEFETEAEDPGCNTVAITLGGNNLTVCDTFNVESIGGNPGLQALTADQFDVNVGWYPSPNTALTVAAFYKDLRNPFVSVATDDPDVIEQLGGAALDPETGLAFTNFERVINAGEGELLGIEIGGNHFLTYIGGWASNLFVSGNLTLIDSEITSVAVRGGEALPLPLQSDVTANLSLGYEDEKFLFRLAANYRGEQLLQVNATDPARDVFIGDFFTTDLVVRYQVTPNFQIFADVANLLDTEELRFYQGDAVSGSVFERVEDFGRTFQFGVNIKF